MTPAEREAAARGLMLRIATTRRDRHAVAALRRAVFCEEQGLFNGDDRDAIDDVAIALGAFCPEVGLVGTVRLHQPQPGVWWGSRLAVALRYRRVGLIGSGLIKLAVGTANHLGCDRFLAHVQARNATLFRRLNWRALGEVELHGLPHVLMEADLDHYPAIAPPRDARPPVLQTVR